MVDDGPPDRNAVIVVTLAVREVAKFNSQHGSKTLVESMALVWTALLEDDFRLLRRHRELAQRHLNEQEGGMGEAISMLSFDILSAIVEERGDDSPVKTAFLARLDGAKVQARVKE